MAYLNDLPTRCRASSEVPSVKEVYAFDPSPVSGKRDSPGYEELAKGLTSYRIYNRGELPYGSASPNLMRQ